MSEAYRSSDVSDVAMYRARTERRLNAVELDVALIKQDHSGVKEDVRSLKQDVHATFVAAIGTLLTALGYILWQILTHGLKQ